MDRLTLHWPSPLVPILSSVFILLIASIFLFLRHWKKNYYDINNLPYYHYCLEEKTSFRPATPFRSVRLGAAIENKETAEMDKETAEMEKLVVS